MSEESIATVKVRGVCVTEEQRSRGEQREVGVCVRVGEESETVCVSLYESRVQSSSGQVFSGARRSGG